MLANVRGEIVLRRCMSLTDSGTLNFTRRSPSKPKFPEYLCHTFLLFMWQGIATISQFKNETLFQSIGHRKFLSSIAIKARISQS
jgi:hypothetical protein